MTWLKNAYHNFFNAFDAFIQSHTTLSNFFLLFWTTFLASWGSKISIPVPGTGGLTINAGAEVAAVQAYLHFPTWLIWAVSAILNLVVAYARFRGVQKPAPTT